MQGHEIGLAEIDQIMEKHSIENGWSFTPCPFCDGREIKVRYETMQRLFGHDSPCSAVIKAWGRCRYCGAEGPKRTGDFVYKEEIVAAALVGWNQRSNDAETQKT